jgi:hypothetical protein
MFGHVLGFFLVEYRGDGHSPIGRVFLAMSYSKY